MAAICRRAGSDSTARSPIGSDSGCSSGWSMRARSSVVAIALAVVAACDRPETLVICHNGNCVGTADPRKDDTLEALQASLDLQWHGRPAIDGIELDTMWHRSTQT